MSTKFTKEDLERVGYRWNESTRSYEPPGHSSSVVGSSPVVQELEADRSSRQVPKPDHKARVSRKNGLNDNRVRYCVEAHFFFSDKRLRDLDGAMSTLLDTLVDAGALSDDNRFIVPRLIVEGHDCEKGQDRVEVTITGINL